MLFHLPLTNLKINLNQLKIQIKHSYHKMEIANLLKFKMEVKIKYHNKLFHKIKIIKLEAMPITQKIYKLKIQINPLILHKTLTQINQIDI